MMEIIEQEMGKIFHNSTYQCFRCYKDCSKIDLGYYCPTVGLACYTICGDSLYVDVEGCDDGDYENNDGCSKSCTVEKGYKCIHHTGSKDTCNIVCGDGYYLEGEGCEDGNTTAGDGCYKDCTVESGWYCKHSGIFAIDICSTKCGDGLKRGTEVCDDGNYTAWDG